MSWSALTLPWNLFPFSNRYASRGQPSTDGKVPWKWLSAKLKVCIAGKTHAGGRPESEFPAAEKTCRSVKLHRVAGRVESRTLLSSTKYVSFRSEPI